MAPASTATREVPAAAPNANPARPPTSTNGRPQAPAYRSTHNTGRPIPTRPTRTATDLPGSTISRAPLTEASGALSFRRPGSPSDDEILGLSAPATSIDGTVGARYIVPGEQPRRDEAHSESAQDETQASAGDAPDPSSAADPSAEPENVRAALDANPDLRRAWDDAQAYRETFSSPEEARTASTLLADLDRMDALFFSRRPEDHAELARAVASLDPAAFASLAQAMAAQAAGQPSPASANGSSVGAGLRPAPTTDRSASSVGAAPTADNSAQSPAIPTAPTQAQTEFFHATNAAAVTAVLESIESQVERLLPEGVSKSARNRVVGEIYRELDTTLRSNRQLAQQMRDAFRSGALDDDHQRALVSLVTGRARQALPGVAKRVLNEWTSTIVAANNDRRTRQRSAEHRVDIAGSGGAGNDGQRSMTPREIDYRRMSDSDILNL